MQANEFRQPLSIEFAPQGSVCEWCGQPAVLQITVAGEAYYDEPEYFCRLCGKEFACAVADSLDRRVVDGMDMYA